MLCGHFYSFFFSSLKQSAFSTTTSFYSEFKKKSRRGASKIILISRSLFAFHFHSFFLFHGSFVLVFKVTNCKKDIPEIIGASLQGLDV